MSKIQSGIVFAFIGSVVVLSFQNCGMPTQLDGQAVVYGPSDYASVPTNNSSNQDDATNGSDPNGSKLSTGDKCEDIYFEEFIRPTGYYQFLATNCAGCHDGRYSDRPAFASANKLVAYGKFKEKEILGGGGISSKAISSHQPGLTGSQHAGIINDFKTGFASLVNPFNSCKGVASADYSLETVAKDLSAVVNPQSLTAAESTNLRVEKGLSLVNSKIVTVDFKLNPYQKLIYNEASKTNAIFNLKKYAPVSYVFDLSASSYTKAKAGDEPAVLLTVEVAPSVKTDAVKKVISGKEYIIGYTQVLNPYVVVSKPVFKFKSEPKTLAWQFKNMSIKINGALRSDATIYSILDARICGLEPISVMTQNNSQILVFSSLKATDKLSLRFADVRPTDSTKVSCTTNQSNGDIPLPASVTWTELTKAGDNGVFFKNCLSCHNSTSASGGLDLSTWENAKARSAAVLSRMNDVNNPMPRSGLLDERTRKLVKLWVDKGMQK